MIDSTAGVRRAAEEEVEKAYEFLAKYAQSPQAKPSVIAGRKRMLDTVTDAFNTQEQLIDELRTQVDILSKRIKSERMPYDGNLNRPATVVDVIGMLASELKAPQHEAQKELFRAQHFQVARQRWADHF